MRKIMVVAPSLKKGGGAERTAALVANALREDGGYEVIVAVTMSDGNDYELVPNIGKVVLRNNGKGLIKNLNRIIALARVCKREQVDVILGYTILGGILACSVKKLTKCKVIVCERQDPYAFSNNMRLIRDWLYKGANGAIFQTKDAQVYFKHICKDSIVIPNFLNDDILLTPLPFKRRENSVVCVGRLDKVKNQALVIEAFSKTLKGRSSWKLLLVGEGPERDSLEALINQLNVGDCVELLGFRDDVLDIINNSKILVLASKYEGYPNALLEGMAMGLMCISSNCPCGGPKDMISHLKNGILMDNMTVDQLKDMLDFAMNNENETMLMAKNALEVRQKNSKIVIIQKWLNYISQIQND